MKLIYTLERKDNVRIFIRHYYHAGRKWIRRLGGPVILLLGLFFYVQYDWRSPTFMYGIVAFVMGYGLYLSLKPFFFILFRTKKFAADQISLEITPQNKLGITDSAGQAKLDMAKISSVVMVGENMILTFDSKASLYVLRERVQEGDLDSFFEAIKLAVAKRGEEVDVEKEKVELDPVDAGVDEANLN